MFDRTVVNASPRICNNVKVQACSGGIYKSHPKSKITTMHITSQRANEMLDINPKLCDNEIVVLQVVNAVEGYVLVEYMLKEDYEKENVYTDPKGTKTE